MDMTAWLNEMTYRLLVCAHDGIEARQHLAIVARWTEVQTEQLRQDKDLCVDHERLVAEALVDDRPAATTAGRTR